MNTKNQIKYIQYGSENTCLFLGNNDPTNLDIAVVNAEKVGESHMVRTIPTQRLDNHTNYKL